MPPQSVSVQFSIFDSMNLYWIEEKRKEILYATYLFLIASVFFSKVALSISMIFLVVLSLLKVSSSGKIGLRNEWQKAEEFVKSNFPSLALCLIFLIIPLTLFHSENINDLFWQLKLKLPYLILPIAFLTFPTLKKNEYYNIHFFLIAFLSLCSIGVLVNYFMNFDAININIKKGQSIPTPIDHVKFSLFTGLAALSGIILSLEKLTFRMKWERYALIGMTLFLILFIHILSVRSGLVAFYIAAFLVGFRYFLLAKNKLPFVIAGLILASAPFIAYKTVPSFQNKVGYVLWDLKMYKEGGGENYSDSGRIRSIKVGWEVIKQSPILGVGFGDLRDQCRSKHLEMYGYQAPSVLPHNQYVTITAASGVVGLLIFLFALLYTLYHQQSYKDNLFSGVMLIFLLSFMVENTLERSYSTGLFLILCLTAFLYQKGKRV